MRHDLYGRPPRPPSSASAGLTRRGLFRLRLTETARLDVDYEALTERTLAGWERGPHDRLLRAVEPVSVVVAEIAGVSAGSRVLDVGAADGNLALACAERGAEVEACDLSAAMVERGRRRTGDRVRWSVADAQRLPYGDGEFDAVVSAFGASSAADPRRTAGELARVAAPGATVALAAWIPRGLPGGLWPFIERIEPLPDGVPSPAEWGREPTARSRLAPHLERVEVRTRSLGLSFAGADDAFEALAGPAPLAPRGMVELRGAFDGLLRSSNAAITGVELPARYLVASGRRGAGRSA